MLTIPPIIRNCLLVSLLILASACSSILRNPVPEDIHLQVSVLGRQGFEMLAGLNDRCECFEFRYGDLEEALSRFDTLTSGRQATS